jgi:hypothetical protein
MKLDPATGRLAVTFGIVSALTLLLVTLLAIPAARLAPRHKPGPVDFDEPTGLVPAGAATR